jgi:hypothetical protein
MTNVKEFLAQHASSSQFTGPPSNVFASFEDKKAVVAQTVEGLVRGLSNEPSFPSNNNPTASFDKGVLFLSFLSHSLCLRATLYFPFFIIPQTDRQTVSQSDRQTNKKTNKKTDIQEDRQTDSGSGL